MEEIGLKPAKMIREKGRRGRQKGTMKTASSAKSCGGCRRPIHLEDKRKEKLVVLGRREKGPSSVAEQTDRWDPVLKQMSSGQREASEAGWGVRGGEDA